MYKITCMAVVALGLILYGCNDPSSVNDSQQQPKLKENTVNISPELKELMREKVQDSEARAKLEGNIIEKLNNYYETDLPKEIDLAIDRMVDEKNKFWGLDKNINDEAAPRNYVEISPTFIDEERKTRYDSLSYEHVRELRKLLQKHEITGPFSFTRQLGTSSEMQTETLQNHYEVGSFVSGDYTGPVEVTYGVQVWTITDYLAPILDIFGTLYEDNGLGLPKTIVATNYNSNGVLYYEAPIYAYSRENILCITVDTTHSLYFEPPAWQFDITCIYRNS